MKIEGKPKKKKKIRIIYAQIFPKRYKDYILS